MQSHVAVFEEKGKSRQRQAKIMSIAHEAGEAWCGNMWPRRPTLSGSCQYCTWNSFSSDAKARPAAGYILTLGMQRMSLRNSCAGAAKSLALCILQQPVTDMVRGAFQGAWQRIS